MTSSDSTTQTAPPDPPAGRRNLAAIVGAVSAVLVIGGIVAAVQAGRGDDKHGAGNPAGAAPPSCPASAPPMHPPAKSTGSLFPDDVTAIRVFRYDIDRLTASKVLDGQVAVGYARRFNALPLPSRSTMCPLFVTRQTVAMLPV